MAKVSIAGFAAVVCLAGCIHQQVSPPTPVEAAPAAQPSPVGSPASQPARSLPPTAPEPGTAPVASTPETRAPSSAPTAQPKATAGTSAATQPRPASAKPSAANTPPKAAGSEPATEARQAAIAATGRQNVPGSPTLDLTSLEQRLRDTRAIGLFTKLSLKNQVDDLLQQFRAFHAGQPKPALTELRQRYELLLLKVVSLLQDGDPPLAAAVSSSRETIWGILMDPARFSKI